jgi:hypothetical protein
MNNEEALRGRAYELADEFWAAINRRDANLLQAKFNLGEKAYKDIRDIKDCFRDPSDASLEFGAPPKEYAFQRAKNVLPFNVSRKKNEKRVWIVEHHVWKNGKISDLRAIFELVEKESDLKLSYLYIDV